MICQLRSILEANPAGGSCSVRWAIAQSFSPPFRENVEGIGAGAWDRTEGLLTTKRER
jgi:hypothetical protein